MPKTDAATAGPTRSRWRLPLPPRDHSAPPLSPAGLVVLLLIAAGIFLRLHAFAFPRTFLFDEHHFVENARNYLAGQPDWNDHPPLGKLLIAASIRIFGDDPVGWRAPALLCGAIIVAGGALATARLFRSAGAGWIAAALLASDGFLISYSRAGLLDGYLGATAVLALLLASGRWTRASAVVAAGLLGGVAPSIKFSGGAVLVTLLASIAIAPLPARRRWKLAAAVAAIAAATYVVAFAIGLALVGHPAGLSAVIDETRRLLDHHAALTDMKNPWTSSWPTWVLPARPLMLGYVGQTGGVRVLSCLGNIATWWAAMAIALAVGWAILSRGIAATLAVADPRALAEDDRVSPGVFAREHGRAALLALTTALAFLAPWVLTRRDSYIYHFLPAYTALVVLLAGFLGWCAERRPFAVLLFLLVVLVVTGYYAPVWSFLPLSEPALRHRLFLPGWR